MNKFVTSSLTLMLALSSWSSAEASRLHRPHAVTLWWVIFNDPEACTANPGAVEKCGAVDVFGAPYLESIAKGAPDPSLIAPNLAAKVAVIYATGGVTDRRRGDLRLTASIFRSPDVPLKLSGPQSIDPFGLGTGYVAKGAEVHLVVRDHGRARPWSVLAQTTNFLDPFCSDPSLGYTSGPNLCQDIQFAVFAPGESGQDAVYSVADGQPVRRATAQMFRQGDVLQAVVTTQVRDRRN